MAPTRSTATPFAPATPGTSAPAALLELDAPSFEREVLNGRGRFLLDLTAERCAPCRALKPIVESIAVRHAGGIRVGTLDVDRYPDVAATLRVRGIPTLIVFEDGREVRRHLGSASEATVRALAGL